MLTNTFQHIPGIGPKTEGRLWAADIHQWRDFDPKGGRDLGFKQPQLIQTCLRQSAQALAQGDPGYFAVRLSPKLHWRMFPEFKDQVVYLDIETTGLDAYHGKITTIATYDGRKVRHYVNGRNLNDFKKDIVPYQLIVSYNGKSFDVPYINNYFGITLNMAHIDLRHVLATLGFRGGLKGCERALGIDRGDLNGIDGYFAVLLWREYQRYGNEAALETLLAYNIADVVNLEQLMVLAYNMKIEHTPFGFSHHLIRPDPPEIYFEADQRIVARIKSRYL